MSTLSKEQNSTISTGKKVKITTQTSSQQATLEIEILNFYPDRK